jgi:hypothetical protein
MSTDHPPTIPACLVRPPWPDELPRLADAFTPASFNRPLHPLVLIVPGTPERIAGFAGVLEPVEGRSGLTCLLRPRYLDSPEGDRLIATALGLARSLGARSVSTADDLPPRDPLGPVLLRAGFTLESTREIRELSLAALAARLERIRTRASAGPDLADHFVIESLTATHLPKVMTLLAAIGLLSPARRHSLELPTPGHDPALSFVIRRDDRILAAALVKARPRGAFLDVLAVDPGHRGGLYTPGCLILWAVVQACLAAGLPALIFVADREGTKGLLQNARRAGAHLRGLAETFIRHFA